MSLLGIAYILMSMSAFAGVWVGVIIFLYILGEARGSKKAKVSSGVLAVIFVAWLAMGIFIMST